MRSAINCLYSEGLMTSTIEIELKILSLWQKCIFLKQSFILTENYFSKINLVNTKCLAAKK